MKTISAAEANRHFSSLLREVSRGEVVTVLSCGKPVATITPVRANHSERQAAKRALLERLRQLRPSGRRDWMRAEFYEDCSGRVALDTNVLAYAEGVGDERRCDMARQWIDRLSSTEIVLPAQALGELPPVLITKANRPAVQAREAALSWPDSFEVADSTRFALQSALDLTVDHQNTDVGCLDPGRCRGKPLPPSSV